MTKTDLSNRLSNLRLRDITICSISLIIVLALLGIAVSFLWPINWNSTLSALILNIVSSLIGVLAGVLMAIFIVERYLEEHRRKIAEQDALQEKVYNQRWQAYLYGGLSILSASITHLSLFVAYGQKKYLELLKAEGDTSKVPDTIEAFITYYMDSTSAKRHEKLEDDVIEGDQSKGMDDKDAARLAKAFSDVEPSEIHCSVKDLNYLLNYLHILHELLRDQIFLFQPFMINRMGLGIILLQLDRNLMNVTDDIQRVLIKQGTEKITSIIQLNKRSAIKYCELGQLAIKVIQLIWNYAQGTSNDFKVVISTDAN